MLDDKKELLDKAADIASRLSKVSTVFNPRAEEKIPRLNGDEVTFGRVLGRGGFCVVNEISAINIEEDLNETLSQDHGEQRKFVSSRCIRNGDARYAVKRLSKEIVCTKDKDLFVKGIIDLAIEVKYLAVMEHPHICKMRAISDSSPYSTDYFIVLDRLYDTLQKRFKTWQSKNNKYKGVFGSMRDMKGKRKNELFYEKLTVCYDIASAVKHLHQNNIIYRDLKPDNIGFDVRGDVKIFDFGLCKELRENLKYEDGTYKLTGYTGSLRFMAPEVAMCNPYNLTADVYSFSIILWMVLTCQTPYKGFSVQMYENLVVKKGARPKINTSWPKPLIKLIEDAWSPKVSKRPDFEEIMDTLRDQIYKLGDDEPCELDTSNRTDNSVKQS